MRYLSFGAKAFIQIGDILFEAIAKGAAGNDISIVLADTLEDATAEITSVVGGVITIGIEDGVTNAGLIVAAVNEDDGEGGAALLISASLVGDTSATAQDAETETYLTCGLDENVNFVALGNSGMSSNKTINHSTETVAGVAYRLKSDSTLSLVKNHGSLVGVSLGYDTQILKSKLCTKGINIPIRLTPGFEPAIGAAVYIDDATGYANAHDSGAVMVTNAIYKTLMMSGEVSRDVEIPIALIDYTGGL